MALEVKDINNAADMQRYVEGCLNDLIEGISTKEEIMRHMKDYTLRVIDITACESQKASTNDSALPMADVGGNEVAFAVEFGYIQCEKGKNLDCALIEYEKLRSK